MFIIYTENNHIVIHKGKGEWAVMSAYDILTGIQLCMMIVMIGYGIFFFKGRTCRIWCFGGPAVLVTFWSAAVVYYYTAYLFLTILCFLMAFFLGLGLGLWFKAGLLDHHVLDAHLNSEVLELHGTCCGVRPCREPCRSIS